MRYSPCLLFLHVAILSTGVSAFFPYKSTADQAGEDEGNGLNERFFPWPAKDVLSDDGDGGDDNGGKKSLSLGIGKVDMGQVRRNNDYDIEEGDPPTKENSIAIGNDGHDYSYITRVAFGSQDQKLWMLIDTGASSTWVMGADCMSDACADHDTFDDESSTTFSETDEDWDVTYGSGEVTGTGARDNVTLGDLEVVMNFGIATNASDDFLSYPMDGILGLGRTGENGKGIPSVMQALSASGLIDDNVLGINLPRSSDGDKDGQITFGDIDEKKFTGDIVYTDTVSDSDLWMIPVDDVGVDGENAGFENKRALVDTGSSYILLPKADMEKLHSLIPGSEAVKDEFVVPCSTDAALQFTFSDVTFDVRTVDYVASSKGSSDKCSSNIKVLPDYYGPNMWLLGDVFLKNVYSVFDFDKSRIGFATLEGDEQSSSSGSINAQGDDPSSTTSTTTGSTPQSTGAGVTVSTSPQFILAMSIMTVVFSSLQFTGPF